MMWREDTCDAVATVPCGMAALAREAGVESAHANDVAGAITTYCRARHGSDELDRDYLLFLIARSGFLPAGTVLPVRDQRLMHALEQAADPASLYEAFRRRLVCAGASDVSSTGLALRVDLRKIKPGPREDLLLIWPHVLRRMADWIRAWRQGNPDIDAVLVSGHPAAGERENSVLELLESAVRGQEKALGLPVLKLYWAG